MGRRDGLPVWVDDNQSPDEALKRIDLSGRSDSGRYDEAWLQNLLHNHPRAFPIRQIEKGFRRTCPVVHGIATHCGRRQLPLVG